MSQTVKTFYNIFWQNRNCRNLFLLSKEELLDRTTIGTGEDKYIYTVPRIIISNAIQSEHYDTIKYRTETQNINLDASLDEKIAHFKPLIEKFVTDKFQKSMDKLLGDVQNNGMKILMRMLKILLNEKKRESLFIEFIQDYGFIGKHIKNMKDLEADLKRSFKPDKNNVLINEKTLIRFFEGVRYLKELYVNNSYKRLYSTNQILANTLNEEDNFTSRIQLFHSLYDCKIITSSNEDAFIECAHCEPDTYRGVFKLKINPKKLQQLKCPVCSQELTYFVPYELHRDIYDIIRGHDGLLLHAYTQTLAKSNLTYRLNVRFLDDIEVDCVFEKEGVTYIVEVKMYKQNTTREKLKTKLRGHYGKLISDISRLQMLPEYKTQKLVPLLVTNIIDSDFLLSVESDLRAANEGIYQDFRILNPDLLITPV